MRIGFIGVGKAGISLGRFFRSIGLSVSGYLSRSRASAQKGAALTDSAVFVGFKDALKQSDILFLTVPDTERKPIFDLLSRLELNGKTLCHASGVLSAEEVFPGIRKLGACGCSLHPLYPIHDTETAWRALGGAFFTVEGEKAQQDFWIGLLSPALVRVRPISSADKKRYHAAAASASNLSCALAELSLSLMGRCGFDKHDALEALAPLMRANLENILTKGPAGALTGPVERNDVQTVRSHLTAIEDEDERALYRSASRLLLKLAAGRHPERSCAAMKTLLSEDRK
ncbi:MAG: Rossmann-like and DUF2520 domain-containing protein [Sutterella sp.]